jgi:hypothetical protein
MRLSRLGLRLRQQQGALSLWVGVTVAVTLALAAVFASRWFGSLYGVRHMEQTFWQRSLAESTVHLALARVNASDSFAGVTTETMTLTVVKPSDPPPFDSPSADLAACEGPDWREISVRLPSGRHWLATAKARYEPLFRTLIDAGERLDLQEITTSSQDWERRDPLRANGGEEPRWGDLYGGQVILRATNPQSIGGNVLCGPSGSLVIDPAVTVRGERRAAARPFPRASMPPVLGALLPFPEGKVATLPGGPYRTSGLYVQKPSRYAFRGPAIIHVEGNAVIGTDTLSSAGAGAGDLVVVVHGTQCEVHLPFMGGIFAPDADVVLHGTGFFSGAIVARTVRNDGSAKLVFDRGLVRRTRGLRKDFRLVAFWPEGLPGELRPPVMPAGGASPASPQPSGSPTPAPSPSGPAGAAAP